jgi:hypothetical protein
MTQMRKGRMAVALTLFALSAASASATVPKVQPWQWKPEKVEARLAAATPIAPDSVGVGSKIIEVACVGRGRGVSGRFTKFACETASGGSGNGNDISILAIRIRPIGTGKLCVVTTPDGYSLAPETYPGVADRGSRGPLISPERRCP